MKTGLIMVNALQTTHSHVSQNKFFCAFLDDAFLNDVSRLGTQPLDFMWVWALYSTCSLNKISLGQIMAIPQFCGNDRHRNCCLQYILLHHRFLSKQSRQVGQLIMTDNSFIQLPAYGIKPRKIEPIKVIKEFGLTHHLAWAVNYIAGTGYKTSVLKDLQKAITHVNREIRRQQFGISPHASSLGKKPLFTISEILEDWRLTPNLEKTVFHILHSCQFFPPELERWVVPGRGSVRLSTKSKDFFYHTFPLIRATRFLNLEIAELQASEQEIGDSR